MTTLYLLSYDEDTGGRESWSVFYSPFEIFDTEQQRTDRIDEIKSINSTLEFHSEDIELNKKLEVDAEEDD